jgi:hypothetical protein
VSQVSEKNSAYQKTISQLIERFDLQSGDSNLMQARRAYLYGAIMKSVDLSVCPKGLHDMTANELVTATADLPDKFSSTDRELVNKASHQRDLTLWHGLMPDEEIQDIMIDFFGRDAQSASEKIQSFINKHNEKAKKTYQSALQQDENDQLINPGVYPKAGKTIDQRQIRLDPDKPNQLQTFDPSKNKWMLGPRLNKFLQESYEWRLFDIVQVGTDLKQMANRSFADSNVPFADFLNQQSYDVDRLFDAGKLKVLISSDPQKVNEMSTGQRWYSCMTYGS